MTVLPDPTSPHGTQLAGWSLVEEFQLGKHADPDRCEDRILTGPVFAVIDGATDKSGLRYRWDGADVSAGRFAATVVADTLSRIPAGGSPRQTVNLLSESLADAVDVQHPDLRPEQRPSCRIVVFDPVSRLVWSVGDCWYGLASPAGLVQHQRGDAVDEVLVRMRALTLDSYAAAGMPWDPASGTPDPGREAIMPVLLRQGAFANTTGRWGYGVLDGQHVPDCHLHVAALPDGCTEVVLASDGYPGLIVGGSMRLASAEFHLADLLSRDPLCVAELAGTKGMTAGQVAHDDRSWLRLEYPRP